MQGIKKKRWGHTCQRHTGVSAGTHQGMSDGLSAESVAPVDLGKVKGV